MKTKKTREIKFCPNCGGALTNNPATGQGVKECLFCDTRFFILITSANNYKHEKEEKNQED
jgi:DNA-directed RNA polymerase subunit M/transcription elongation factor TFIIS